MAAGVSSISVNHHNLLLWLSSLSQGFLLLASQLGFVTSTGTLVRGHLHPPSFVEWRPKFFNFLSCSPTLSASPKPAEQ